MTSGQSREIKGLLTDAFGEAIEAGLDKAAAQNVLDKGNKLKAGVKRLLDQLSVSELLELMDTANVPAIEPSTPQSPKATIREKLEAHANDANCAACHAKIDPLGLAWDNYDAIGQWRTHEKVAAGVGKDPLVDPSGLMPDGRAFKDANDFKRLLLADREKVARAFIEHLCTYGLRRVLTVDDEDDINAIAAEAKKNRSGVKDIVRAVAMSELMRKR
jgi:hypothetical protein